jgi:CHAT domain-containing protein
MHAQPGLVETLRQRMMALPEIAQLVVSAVALVVLIAGVVYLVKWTIAAIGWAQRRYWETSPGFRRAFKISTFVTIGVGLLGMIVGGIVRASLLGWSKAAMTNAIVPLGDDPATRVVQVTMALAAIGMLQLFFLSSCKSQRADMIERLLESGDLARAVTELEALRKEPGQNVSVDARVDCLDAYALVLAGRAEEALDHLEDSERRMSGSTALQEMMPYGSGHALRHNVEAVEWMRLRIGRILCDLGRYHDALRVTEARVSQIANDVARLNVRGIALGGLGRFDEATRAFVDAVTVSQPVAGGDPAVAHEVATVQRNLGHALFKLGHLREARQWLDAAIASMSARLAPGHPDVVDARSELARVDAAQGMTGRALTTLDEVMAAETRFLAMAAGGMREPDLLRLIRRMHGHFEQYLSLVVRAAPTDASRVAAAAGHVLRRKGLTLRASAWTRALAGAAGAKGARLRTVRARLSELMLATSGGHSEAARNEIAKLNAERQSLEAALAGDSRGDAVHALLDDVSLDAVRAALPPTSVLIEFVAAHVDADVGSDGGGAGHYLAFVVSPAGHAPALVDLGPADRIDALAAAYHEINERGGDSPRGGGPDWLVLARELYDALIAPLDPLIGAADELVLAPDGGLNFVPFAALAGPGGRFLIERYQLSYVSAGRDLVQHPRQSPRWHEAPALLVGDPAFDAQIPDAGGSIPGRARRTRGLGADPTLAAQMARPHSMFPPLPGTRAEVAAIGSLLDDGKRPRPGMLLGAAAAKSGVLAVHSPAILHLATHAYFLAPTPGEQRAESGFSSSIGFSPASGATPFEGLRGGSSNPYLRSGLVLAGAARGAYADPDGLLTAEEVLGLDLAGTDMVVLSACQTALGTSVTGEGVQGLHRAFTIAGAGAVVASLWKVPDQETAQLMERFYGDYLRTGRRAAALRLAMRSLIEELTLRTGSAHPAKWAAFVCYGPPER